MPPIFVDTHCHLFWEDFREDLDAVVARACEAGVTRILIPATNLETLAEARSIAGRFEGIFFAAGIHPQDGKDLPADYLSLLRDACADARAVAIGEIGLDYYWDSCPKDRQQRILHEQLALAKERSLPVILHNRDSGDDLLSILREHQEGSLRGQFHCFGGTVEFARAALDLGFHLSFTGNVTYKKSALDPLLAFVPADRLLIETDAPFMTPVPFRGKRNEPAHIPLIAARYAQARGESVERIAEATTRNALRLFSLESR